MGTWRLGLLLFTCLSLFGADISGTWSFVVKTPLRSGKPTFTFKQEGDKLTGTYSGQLGEAPVRGTVKGDQVEFEFDPPKRSVTVRYKGTIESPTKMQGTATFGSITRGSWTATKN